VSKQSCRATPEMIKLAQQASDCQNACNSCGLAQSFAKVMLVLIRSDQSTGSAWVNQHPITKAWIDKFAHLAHYEQDYKSSNCHSLVMDLIEGKDIEFEVIQS
jgi:hypothetical protein